MKLKTLRNKLVVTSYDKDNAEVIVEIDEARLHYTGYKKSITKLKIKKVSVARKQIIFYAEPSNKFQTKNIK